jgi:hypothetical protein
MGTTVQSGLALPLLHTVWQSFAAQNSSVRRRPLLASASLK